MSEENKLEVKKSVIEVSDEGFLKAKDIDSQYRIAKLFLEAEMVPRSYKTPQQVMVGMQFAIELGLKPLQGLRNIAVINGNPSLWGELPLALARKSGELEYITEFLIDKEYNKICFDNKNLSTQAWAAVCKIKRKNQPEVETFFSMDDAKIAGLLNREKKTPWDTYPKIMLTRRARSQALKTAFADSLSALSIAEYDNNYLPEESDFKDVTPQGEVRPNVAGELNSLFESEHQGQH